MRISKLDLGLVAALLLPACDDGGGSGATSPGTGGDDGGDDGDDGNTGGDDGATMAATAGDDDGGTADETGGDDGPIDPTGEFECPADPYAESATFVGAVRFSDEPDSQTIDVLDGIGVITGDLIIDNTGFTNVDFLNCIVEVRGDIQIFHNPFLEDLSGTNNITKVGRLPALNPTPQNPNFVDSGKGNITITDNAVLPDLNGFGSLAQIGEQDDTQPMNMSLSASSLVITDNTAMVDFTGFNSLLLIYASLIINDHPVLTNIDGLSNLQGVGGAFSVTRNPELCISSVNAVGGGLDYLGEPENSTTEQNNEGC